MRRGPPALWFWKKTGPREGPGFSMPAWGPATNSRGEHAARRRLWEDIDPPQQLPKSMRAAGCPSNRASRMSAMPFRRLKKNISAEAHSLEIPPLRVGDEEIAEDLNARHRFEFLRIDEERIERERVGVTEQLHQAAVFLDQVVRQHGDAEPALAGAQ